MRIVSSQRSEAKSRSRQRPPIGDLAVLPVFYKLAGKKVLLAGGSDAAAWKGQLLAAAGATVIVIAEELGTSFRTLIEDPENREKYQWYSDSWSERSFTGMTLAICDADHDEEAAAFYHAAKKVGVPVNVIDRPQYCDFQFGSIVNRSPAVVSISTDGAAPILGQAMRRRIETLLPPSLSRWAQIAHQIRAQVTERLQPGPQRRAFWEYFVDRAFDTEANENSAERLIAESERIASASKNGIGRVTLVGAGPGDAELLTLKSVRALQSADVILFDDLVSSDVLELARREAKRMLVGKRGGRQSCRQQDINDMMVTLAKSGKHVVRLKGGDPMVFGRAGEEIQRLRDENIPVSVVPGITSALAMASALGVSLTHRDHAQSVRFITGHSRRGGLPEDMNWVHLADPKTTSIFYMGGRMAEKIATRLQENGIPSQTPTVMISAISRPEEKHWRGTVGELSKGAQKLGIEHPVLIGIGDVFKTARARTTGNIERNSSFYTANIVRKFR
ncbi:MAG: siroheme synthase CysG [Stappiaceae bacterium]